MKTKINFRSDRIGRFIVKRNILLLFIALSLISIMITPRSVIERGVSDNLAWLGYGTLATESLFIVGLGIMAYEAGHILGKNPLVWRKKINQVLKRVVKTKFFWLGFWINATGALGTTILVAVGIVKVLPPQSWILLGLPAVDIGLTLAVRMVAIYAAKDIR